METWEAALQARTDLQVYGDNAIGLFALALRFSVDDLDSVAADAITDGTDDKKCDLVYVEQDDHAAVVAQCYISRTPRAAAPSNKASDLNTAVSWLLATPVAKLPARLTSAATALREAIESGIVTELHVWYIHNLRESRNVRDELDVVHTTASNSLKAHFSGKDIRVFCKEVGSDTLGEWYSDSLTPILVGDDFTLTVPNGFQFQSTDWTAYVTAVPAKFLHKIYRTYKTKLFSANVRDYLGSRKSDQNINHGIKVTADTDPNNFWVFNNGLTILVNDFIPTALNGKIKLTIRGLSIVNGAQTTGAIGSLKKAPAANAHVAVRFIKTGNREVVYDIIRYNNSQNKVTAPDFRSTDRIQKRLKQEMQKITSAEYEGGRRGGHEDLIRRRPNLLPSYTVGQALAAAHGNPVVAYHQKSDIWILDNLYATYFNEETTAAHIVFVYSLLRAVEARKVELLKSSKDKPDNLTSIEQKQLEFFRNRGSTYLFASAVAACMETFLGRRVTNTFRLSFVNGTAPSSAQGHWRDIVSVTAPLCTHLADALTDGLKSVDKVRKVVQTFQGLVEVTAGANAKHYRDFANRVVSR